MQLSEDLRAEILVHAKDTMPHECCGLVAVVSSEVGVVTDRGPVLTPV